MLYLAGMFLTFFFFKKCTHADVENNLAWVSFRLNDLVDVSSRYAWVNTIALYAGLALLIVKLGFHDRISIVGDTVAESSGELSIVIALSFIINLVFSFVAWNSFGSYAEGFDTFILTFETVMMWMFGDFQNVDVLQLYHYDKTRNAMYFIVFYITMWTSNLLPVIVCNIATFCVDMPLLRTQCRNILLFPSKHTHTQTHTHAWAGYSTFSYQFSWTLSSLLSKSNHMSCEATQMNAYEWNVV